MAISLRAIQSVIRLGYIGAIAFPHLCRTHAGLNRAEVIFQLIVFQQKRPTGCGKFAAFLFMFVLQLWLLDNKFLIFFIALFLNSIQQIITV